MSDFTYRVRRFLYGSPIFGPLPPSFYEVKALHKQIAAEQEPRELCGPVRTLPSGRKYRAAKPIDGMADEIAFRRYARRSGEHVCSQDHKTLVGRCVDCHAAV